MQLFLQLQPIQVSFTVVPTTYTEENEVKVDLVFETRVPAPVVVVTPPSVDYNDVVANGGTFFYLKNHGWIDAENVQMSFPGSASSPVVFSPGLPDCEDPAYFCPTILSPGQSTTAGTLGPLLAKIPSNATVKVPVYVAEREMEPQQRRRLFSGSCITLTISTSFTYPW